MKKQIPVEKNKEYIVDIIDNGFEGEGIAKVDGYTVFIAGAIKGEKCRILILKVTTSHAFGKIIEILDKTKERRKTDCTTYQKCGGCTLRHIKYEHTLVMKQNMVQNLVNKTLVSVLKVETTIGMEDPLHYRNKAQYPLGLDKENRPVVGIYAQRTHNIIPMDNCLIQSSISEIMAKNILKVIRENKIVVYDEQSQKRINKAYCYKIRFEDKTSYVHSSS